MRQVNQGQAVGDSAPLAWIPNHLRDLRNPWLQNRPVEPSALPADRQNFTAGSLSTCPA